MNNSDIATTSKTQDIEPIIDNQIEQIGEYRQEILIDKKSPNKFKIKICHYLIV